MISLRRTYAIVLRQFYLMRGSIARILPLFAWAAIDIVLWGFFTKYLNGATSTGFDFVPALLGAVLFWDFFIRVAHGVSTAFLEDVWSRNFLNMFATPISTPEYVSGLVLTSIFTSAIGLVVMVALATVAFGLSFLAYGVMVVPFVGVLFLFGIAIGVMASALVLRLGPAAEWFVWPIPALISPFVGVFYPVTTLPGWMQIVSRVLPPSYVFESMRGVILGRDASGTALGIAGVLAAGYVLLAVYGFAKVYQSAVRTGLIARYSAETTS